MPNGGSDNCGTCWFNRKNKGEYGSSAMMAHLREPGPAICEVRNDLVVPNPLYTYCVNHPHHNPTRITAPIGPVFRDEGHHFWQPSPDTPEIREALLAALADVAATPRKDYPAGPSFGEVVMWQLAEFRETRALPLLEQIARTNFTNSFGVFGEHLERLPGAAERAIATLRKGASDAGA